MRTTLFATIAFAACSTNPIAPQPDLGPRSSLTDDQAAQARAACMFGPGTTPGLSLAQTAPIGPELPIDNIVVVMMENRSFDHVLGNLPATGVSDVDVAAADAQNPDGNGNPVPRFHLGDYCFDDTNHEWNGCLAEYDAGKNDGFVKANQGGFGDAVGKRAMGYYDQTDIPFLYALAGNYAINDRYFCSVLGPTFPNREYLYAATSFGYTYNALIMASKPTIFTAMSGAGVNWLGYAEKYPGSAIFVGNYSASLNNYERLDSFFSDAQAGMLPSVAFIDPNLTDANGPSRDDDHPPGDPQEGDVFLAKIVKAVTTSPQWPHLALFITFDEHGGLYDHVPPPSACAPDSMPPLDDKGNPAGGGFDRYGFRVPLIVVSPYARPKYVSHVVHDHTSITRFIEARFLLGALTKRDANAEPLYDLFDFSKPQLLTPPALPDAPLDQAKLAACQALF